MNPLNQRMTIQLLHLPQDNNSLLYYIWSQCTAILLASNINSAMAPISADLMRSAYASVLCEVSADLIQHSCCLQYIIYMINTWLFLEAFYGYGRINLLNIWIWFFIVRHAGIVNL